MRKFYVFVLLAVWSVSSFGNVVTGVAAIPEGYYDAVDHQSNAETILNTLCSIIVIYLINLAGVISTSYIHYIVSKFFPCM